MLLNKTTILCIIVSLGLVLTVVALSWSAEVQQEFKEDPSYDLIADLTKQGKKEALELLSEEKLRTFFADTPKRIASDEHLDEFTIKMIGDADFKKEHEEKHSLLVKHFLQRLWGIDNLRFESLGAVKYEGSVLTTDSFAIDLSSFEDAELVDVKTLFDDELVQIRTKTGDVIRFSGPGLLEKSGAATFTIDPQSQLEVVSAENDVLLNLRESDLRVQLQDGLYVDGRIQSEQAVGVSTLVNGGRDHFTFTPSSGSMVVDVAGRVLDADRSNFAAINADGFSLAKQGDMDIVWSRSNDGTLNYVLNNDRLYFKPGRPPGTDSVMVVPTEHWFRISQSIAGISDSSLQSVFANSPPSITGRLGRISPYRSNNGLGLLFAVYALEQVQEGNTPGRPPSPGEILRIFRD